MEELKDKTDNLINFPANNTVSDNDTYVSIVNDKPEIEQVVVSSEELQEFLQTEEAQTTDSISFKIENFEGPLDLLLHLIKKSKLEIEHVKLSQITEQYLEIMKQIDKVDMEVASEFIEVAATLIEIKSKALLPKLISDEEEEEDPEALLLQRLNEYKLFKETVEKLKPLENVERFYKKPEPEANKFRIVLKDMDMEMLLDAFTGILHRVTESEKITKPKEVMKEIFTVQGQISIIKDALVVKNKVRFSELFENSSTRSEIIVTFLAILEMLKFQEIKVTQSGEFGDIEIIKSTQESEE